MFTTDEETKCYWASLILFFIPTVIAIVLSLEHGEGVMTVVLFLFVWLFIGGLISIPVSDVAELFLIRSNKKSEVTDWIKAFAYVFGIIIIGSFLLALLGYLISLFVDFREFLENKEEFDYWKSLSY